MTPPPLTIQLRLFHVANRLKWTDPEAADSLFDIIERLAAQLALMDKDLEKARESLRVIGGP